MGLTYATPLPVFILLLLACSCKSDDHLTPAKLLSTGDKLISNGGIFALGFFSLTNSAANSYVGIWYHNIPVRTYVWVANRDNPITSSSPGKLVLTTGSDLVLSDSKGHTLWTTANSISPGGIKTTAILLDSGNLVIRLPNGTDIWQSFHHPTDTILPNMTLPLSNKNSISMHLVAWKGPDDPSASDYSFGVDSSSSLQILVTNGSRPYWRRAALDGVWVYAMYQSKSGLILSQTIANRGGEFYLTYTVSDGSPSMRMMLHYTGMVKFLVWNSNSLSWEIFLELPGSKCDRYASCGPFGYCDATQPVATCKCLDGFESDGLNFSVGCQRKKELHCGEEDSFITLLSMKTPDKFLYIRNRSFDQCATECSRNCSCTAYAYANLSTLGTTVDQSRCLVWMGELVDTGKHGDDFGENLYLRIRSSSVSKKKTGALKIALPVVSSLAILVCIYLVWICNSRGKFQTKGSMNISMEEEQLGNYDEPYDQKFPWISFKDIVPATHGFSESNVLGKGGFGIVYKGTLEGGKEVAVKRLTKCSDQGIEHFRNEVVLISKLQHRNLVRLLGSCIRGDEKLLVYEYLSNKSLDYFLFDDAKKSMLDWSTRFNIIKGVARGLLYLHHDSRMTIIHRDLKASNVLLDVEMRPKISDFGMARIFGDNQQQASTRHVVGTYGYMSPEYAMEGIFSVKSDVYSYGVLLLEIVSGLKSSSPHHLIRDFPNLIDYAWNFLKDGKSRDFLDLVLLKSCSLRQVSLSIHIGLLCVQDFPTARPLMSQVVSMLDNEAMPLTAPEQPLYFVTRKREAEELRADSVNNASLTTLVGRNCTSETIRSCVNLSACPSSSKSPHQRHTFVTAGDCHVCRWSLLTWIGWWLQGVTDDDEQANEEMYEQNLYEAALDEEEDAVDEEQDAVEMDEKDQHYNGEEPGGHQALRHRKVPPDHQRYAAYVAMHSLCMKNGGKFDKNDKKDVAAFFQSDIQVMQRIWRLAMKQIADAQNLLPTSIACPALVYENALKAVAKALQAEEEAKQEDARKKEQEKKAREEAKQEDARKKEEEKKAREEAKQEDARKKEQEKKAREEAKQEDARKKEQEKKAREEAKQEDARKKEEEKKAREEAKQEDARKKEEAKKAREEAKQEEARKKEEAKKAREEAKQEDARKKEEAKKAREEAKKSNQSRKRKRAEGKKAKEEQAEGVGKQAQAEEKQA
ncbi:hypothetical protein ACQ4PT_012351 [Festuca glaucescens]